MLTNQIGPAERRQYLRLGPKSGLLITLIPKSTTDSNSITGSVVNLSRGGAYIQTSKPVNSGCFEAIITLAEKGQTLSSKTVSEVLTGRSDNSKTGCALKFNKILSPEETDGFVSLCIPSRSSEMAKSDFDVVNREIEYARQSRIAIFVTILSCLCAWTGGAIAVSMAHRLPSSIGLTIGASVPAILLAIGIFTNVFCVNFLNQRKSFLALLTYYFRNGMIPLDYLGWIHLSINRHACKNKIKQQLCTKKQNDSQLSYCHQLKNDNTTKYRILTDATESIGKIIGIVYFSLFIISTGILIGVVLKQINPFLAYFIGIISFVVCIYMYLITRSLSKGTKSIESYYLQWKDVIQYCGPILGPKLLKNNETNPLPD